MARLIYLFGYGSLIGSPERALEVVDTQLGLLKGYTRSFNKRSPVRGCPRRDAFDAFSDVPDNFRRAELNHSLAVGAHWDPGGEMYGTCLTYQPESERTLLAETDRREGYEPAADQAKLGYLRSQLTVERPRRADTVKAWVYLSNPGGAYHLPDDVSLKTCAKLLINATPRPNTPTAWGGRALGLLYLELIRNGLRQYGVVDPYLERMAQTVHALPGPWTRLVTEPQPRK